MIPPHVTPTGIGVPSLSAVPRPAPESREIVEVGPTTGAISLPIVQGYVFVSADGTWGRAAS